MNNWTSEEDATLRADWPKSTAEAIGIKLGRSKTGVWARVRRLKLKSPKESAIHINSFKELRGIPKKPNREPRRSEAYQFFGEPKTLLDLPHHSCHFPVEGTNLFCGADSYPGKPYCEKHALICGQAYNTKFKIDKLIARELK